jgi:hypothetical protein
MGFIERFKARRYDKLLSKLVRIEGKHWDAVENILAIPTEKCNYLKVSLNYERVINENFFEEIMGLDGSEEGYEKIVSLFSGIYSIDNHIVDFVEAYVHVVSKKWNGMKSELESKIISKKTSRDSFKNMFHSLLNDFSSSIKQGSLKFSRPVEQVLMNVCSGSHYNSWVDDDLAKSIVAQLKNLGFLESKKKRYVLTQYGKEVCSEYEFNTPFCLKELENLIIYSGELLTSVSNYHKNRISDYTILFNRADKLLQLLGDSAFQRKFSSYRIAVKKCRELQTPNRQHKPAYQGTAKYLKKVISDLSTIKQRQEERLKPFLASSLV